MDRKNLYPIFATAPETYSKRFLDDLSRSLNQLVFLLRNPGDGRQTTLVLTNLPTAGGNLEPGTLYRDGDVIRIVLERTAYPTGFQASSSLGSVTVSLP